MKPLMYLLYGAPRRALPLVVFTLFSFLISSGHGATANAGSIAGTVSNTATGNLLEGAKVEVPSLGLAALTDNTGRFVFSGVPAGTHDVVVSYLGLDTE